MSANRVKAIYDADRRLTLLRLLDEGGGNANTSMLEKGLIELGHPKVDRAVVHADARYLAAAGAVTIEELKADLLVVTLTDKGERAARGRERIDGVARPSAD